jgi:phosphoglycolate phosphatase-like HAD superfamily hydrolase
MLIYNLNELDSIFWDFDGVIKESLEVKTEAFVELFKPFGSNIVQKVKNHHQSNGASRYDKFPLYLDWAGKKVSKVAVDDYVDKFSKLVKKQVIDSSWVPGVKEFILKNSSQSYFFILTNTPQLEIEEILSELNIRHFFKDVIGAPTNKADGMKYLIRKYSLNSQKSIMIGDALSDYNASITNNVNFVLRKTKFNKPLQKELKCEMIENFLL